MPSLSLRLRKLRHTPSSQRIIQKSMVALLSAFGGKRMAIRIVLVLMPITKLNRLVPLYVFINSLDRILLKFYVTCVHPHIFIQNLVARTY